MFSSALRQSMATVHTWGGVFFCWFLFLLFVTGSVGFYDTTIDHWMEPEVATPTVQERSLEQSIDTALAYLEKEAPEAANWQIYPAGATQSPKLAAVWLIPGFTKRYEKHLNMDGNQEGVRDTGGGQTLYQAHYGLKYVPIPHNFRIMAIATFFMFLALVSGVITHRMIFKDMFTFRSGKKQQSWLDGHLLMAVPTLPFQFLMTFSGLMFVAGVILPLIGALSFGGNPAEVNKNLAPFFNRISAVYNTGTAPVGEPAPQYSLQKIAAVAADKWGEKNIRSVEILYPGDAASKVSVHREYQGVKGFGDVMLFDGVTGELLKNEPAVTNPATGFLTIMTGLHQAIFAGPLVRFLYFLSGLAGVVMVGTGAVYWTVKRRSRLRDSSEAGFGLKLIEHLNVGAITGVPASVAVYFMSNRLLPIGMEGRMEWEIHCMFIAMGLMFVYPLFRSVKSAWREQFWIASAAFALVPVVNALTTDAHLLNSVPAGDWKMAGVDLACIVMSVVFAGLAKGVKRFWKEAHFADKLTDTPVQATLTGAV